MFSINRQTIARHKEKLIHFSVFLVFLLVFLNRPNLWRLSPWDTVLLGFTWGMVQSQIRKNLVHSLWPALVVAFAGFFLSKTFDFVMVFGLAIASAFATYADQFWIHKRGFTLVSIVISSVIRLLRAAFSLIFGASFLYFACKCFHPVFQESGDPVETYRWYAGVAIIMMAAGYLFDRLLQSTIKTHWLYRVSQIR